MSKKITRELLRERHMVADTLGEISKHQDKISFEDVKKEMKKYDVSNHRISVALYDLADMGIIEYKPERSSKIRLTSQFTYGYNMVIARYWYDCYHGKTLKEKIDQYNKDKEDSRICGTPSMVYASGRLYEQCFNTGYF